MNDFVMPSLWQWIKAGIGLTLGVWITALVLYVPTVTIFIRFWFIALSKAFGVH